MPKVTLNSALTSITGTIDNWVYRKTDDGEIIAKRLNITAEPTPAQLAVRERFRLAAAYAKTAIADPVLGPRYTAAARAKDLRPFPFAVADFFNPPEVRAVDTARYRGAVGDVIKVRALDDFEVTGVTVVIRDAANAVLEQGAAVLLDGAWHYTATTAVAAGTAVMVEAVATDRPGNTGTLSVSLEVLAAAA